MLDDAQFANRQFIDLQRAKPRLLDGHTSDRKTSNRKTTDRKAADRERSDGDRAHRRRAQQAPAGWPRDLRWIGLSARAALSASIMSGSLLPEIAAHRFAIVSN
jgi:hypothetical protein